MGPASKRPAAHIALLTDFSWHNWYIGVMKAVILGINPAVRIVDLAHNVSSQRRVLTLQPDALSVPSGTWHDLLAGESCSVPDRGIDLSLSPYQVRWLKV